VTGIYLIIGLRRKSLDRDLADYWIAQKKFGSGFSWLLDCAEKVWTGIWLIKGLRRSLNLDLADLWNLWLRSL